MDLVAVDLLPSSGRKGGLVTDDQIGGIDVRALAEEFGTPTYVYDRAVIEERIGDLRDWQVIRYAQKANSNLAVLDVIRQAGAVVDAVSAGEIHRALLAGFHPRGTPPGIVYTADIFDEPALDLVVRHGIVVNIGSPGMIAQLARRSPGHDIWIRVNPGFGHGHSRKTNTGGASSKHGVWHEEVPRCLELAHQHGVAIRGLHMHIGSGTDLKHLEMVADAMLGVAAQVGPCIHTVSIGGGLPIPYQPGDRRIDLSRYRAIWRTRQQEIERALDHPVELEIEPGRYLVAEAGSLLCEIRTIKRQGTNTFYLLDAGFNNLARPILYGAYHRMSVVHRTAAPARAETVEAIVGGPLCESGDIFTQHEGGLVVSRPLPRAAVGDLLVIHDAGAYGFTMSSNYNSKPLAAEVLVDHCDAHLVRRRQSLDDLVRGEMVPGQGKEKRN